MNENNTGRGSSEMPLLANVDRPRPPNKAEKLLLIGFAGFCAIQAFEAPIRYGLTLYGLDYLIFVRDAFVVFSLFVLLFYQVARNKIQGAFFVFALLVLFHGTVAYLLTGSVAVPIFGAKVLMGVLFGACLAPLLTRPWRGIIIFLLIVWVALVAGLALEWVGVIFPWRGLYTDIAGIRVHIQQKWGSEGIDRIGGFTRGSIPAALQVSVTAIFLLVFLRSISLRMIIAITTAVVLVLTTQKGAIISYGVVLLCLSVASNSTLAISKIALAVFALLVFLAPVALDGYHISSGHGVFSLESFRDRIEFMWPDGWKVIGRSSWLFGTGLGGIGGGQRLLPGGIVNAADNLFVFAYGYFGVFSFIYIAIPLFCAMRVPNPLLPPTKFALLTLVFLVGYGVVINLLEGTISTVFLGIALQLLSYRASSALAATTVVESPTRGRSPVLGAGGIAAK